MLQAQTTTEVSAVEVSGERWLAEFFDRIAFSPSIDIPLTVVVLLLFLLHFRGWAKSANAEALIDLPSRLPTACIRATLCLLSLLAFCYFTGVGVWVAFALLLVVGCVLSVVLANESAVELMFTVCASLFREACFGFPTLILDGVPEPDNQRQTAYDELIGQHGTTTSPLRPSGYVNINGEKRPAVSETGEMINSESPVVVTGIRNGQACVKLENS